MSKRPKSILYFSFSQLPSTSANSVHVLKMCQALKKNGRDVTLLASLKSATLHQVFQHYHVQIPFTVRSFPMPSVRVFGKFWYLLNALWFALRGSWDLIYSRDLWSGFLLTLFGKEIVFECHQVPTGGFKLRLLHRVVRSPKTKKVVCISDRMRFLLTRNSDFGGKTLVEHDAVDLSDAPEEKSGLRKSLNLPENRFLLGYTGSLHRGRGIDVILQLAGYFPDLGFVIVGGSENQVKEIRHLTETMKLGNLWLAGFVPYERVTAYLGSFDALLMPYQKQVTLSGNVHNTAEFMSPLKMFEYMGSGKPIVSSDLPVLREVLQNGKNALLVPPAEVSAWCEAVKKLHGDPALALRLGTQARRDVEAHTWDRRAERILEALEK